MIEKLRLVAATTATTAAAAAVFPTTTTTTTTAARGAFFAGLGNVDGERASVHVFAVEGLDGSVRFLSRTHGNETKSTGTAGFAVHHQVGFSDRAVRSECVAQVVFSGIEGKVSYK